VNSGLAENIAFDPSGTEAQPGLRRIEPEQLRDRRAAAVAGDILPPAPDQRRQPERGGDDDAGGA
jgi:hypothetical protein